MRYLVVVLIALVFAPSASADGWPAVNELASKVAGRTVDVHCVTKEQWERDPYSTPLELGYAIIERGYAVLPPQTCGPLVLLLADPNERTSIKGYGLAEGRALLLLLHEATHLSGVTDEAQTECRAFTLLRPTLQAIGVKKKRAEQLFQAAKALHLQMPPSYRNGC